jgi:hypothetical protein
MNWDAMKVSENGRFCEKCRKEVFDLTNCSFDEVLALQGKHGSICGSIRVAAVAISLSAAACQNGTSSRTTGMVPPRTATSSISEKPEENGDSVILGKICPPDRSE